MAQAQKPHFVFRRKGRAHLNRQGRQFSRLLAAEVCASAVVLLDTPISDKVWRVLATHSIRQFPLHFPSRASPCAITFQLDSTINVAWPRNVLLVRAQLCVPRCWENVRELWGGFAEGTLRKQVGIVCYPASKHVLQGHVWEHSGHIARYVFATVSSINNSSQK